jgi:hypothetical protein
MRLRPSSGAVGPWLVVNFIGQTAQCFLRHWTMTEGAIMKKSLVTGIAACAALAVFAGNASAYGRKPIYRPRAQAVSSAEVYRLQAPTRAALTAKGGLLHDCVHITFPQCGRGYGEPND